MGGRLAACAPRIGTRAGEASGFLKNADVASTRAFIRECDRGTNDCGKKILLMLMRLERACPDEFGGRVADVHADGYLHAVLIP